MKLSSILGYCLTTTCLALLGSGCENKQLRFVVEEGPTAQRVNLPPIPTLPPPPPVRANNNAYTVYGVRHEKNRNWNQEVDVQGYIRRIYVATVPGTNPPRNCTQNDSCSQQPQHIYIADSNTEEDPENMMLVTGYARFQSDMDAAIAAADRGQTTPIEGVIPPPGTTVAPTIPTDFFVGNKVTIHGRFAQRVTNGMGDSNGVIEYLRHTTDERSPNMPPPRPRRR